MKHKAVYSELPHRYRRRYSFHAMFLGILVFLTSIEAFFRLIHSSQKEYLVYAVPALLLSLIYLFYLNRIYPRVFYENGYLYRSGFFFGFKFRFHEDDIRRVLFKKTLRGKSILILSRDCRGEPSTWSKNVIVLRDCPTNREFLKYFWEKEKRDLFL